MSEHYYTIKPTSKERRGLLKCTLRGNSFQFITNSGVFSPKRIDNGTRILIETMVLPKKGNLLDIGCGYGPIGIVAAKLNPDLNIWMTDLNMRAIELTNENIKLNDLNKIKILQGDLYEPVKNILFNVVLSNPPISSGMKKVIEPLIYGADSHLEPKGSLQLVVQSNKGGKRLSDYLVKYFGSYEVLEKKSGYTVMAAFKQ
ncbi:class I SAM-dependent methyltransferase [Candidatus Bathyarchaeota archaeon]|nr:class I SAM-dependent methyltransferase [Candidatus Bathyarchaeota archaeon]